jgi:hypothetical protein
MERKAYRCYAGKKNKRPFDSDFVLAQDDTLI